MKPTHKTHDLRARLREHVPLEPEHELHAQSLALLAEIEAALDEAGSIKTVDKVESTHQ